MNNNRPLSPHLTVHKWILTQITSILHRATGIGSFFSIFFISLWLLFFSLGPSYYSVFELIFFNFFGKLIILIIAFCVSFYLIDEVRRFFWGLGLGLDIKVVKVTSYILIIFSLIFTLSVFLFLL
tara:strand:+ start:648 stop:1022 length:375 start_codon:yes stop_codon:yes gene_type:complete